MVWPVVADGVGCEYFQALNVYKDSKCVIYTPLFRFIIDGVITLPIALYGFLIFPDVPATTKAFYLSEEVHHIQQDPHHRSKAEPILGASPVLRPFGEE